MAWTVYLLRVAGDALPFYVGCTSRTDYRRLVEHNRSKIENAAKKTLMDAARLAGKTIVSEPVEAFEDEGEALAEEARLIAFYGRFPNGCLTNKTDGGRGGLGQVFSEESRAAMSRAKVGNTINLGRSRPDTRERSRKPVSVYSEDGTWLASCASAREAASSSGISFGQISEAASGKITSSRTKSGTVLQFRFGEGTDNIGNVAHRSQASRRKHVD